MVSHGEEVTSLPVHQRALRGMGYAPEKEARSSPSSRWQHDDQPLDVGKGAPQAAGARRREHRGTGIAVFPGVA